MNNSNCCGGHNHPDKEIEEKLAKLESSVEAKQPEGTVNPVSDNELVKINSPTPIKDDLYYFSGIALIAFGLITLFQHVQVGTGLLQALGLGAHGFGLLMLPLLLGIGLIVYNHKNKLGYAVLSVTCAIIFYAVLSGLIMTFAPMSLLGLIFMLAPLAVGSAFVVRGMGGPKGIEYKLRQQGLTKSEMK